ncbi:hypothetical protein HYU13_00185 [Candidatus Woesearchaeota archaeon]|nr:hypothetical protein [Candidatus Woesearchaeota archaeon]
MDDGIFVKIDEYRNVLDTIRAVKSKIQDAKDNIQKIKNLKDKEDAELATWSAKLSAIEDKIGQMDNSLVKPSM